MIHKVKCHQHNDFATNIVKLSRLESHHHEVTNITVAV